MKNDYYLAVSFDNDANKVLVRKLLKDRYYFDFRYKTRFFESCDFVSVEAWNCLRDFISLSTCKFRQFQNFNFVVLRPCQVLEFLKDECEVKL